MIDRAQNQLFSEHKMKSAQKGGEIDVLASVKRYVRIIRIEGIATG